MKRMVVALAAILALLAAYAHETGKWPFRAEAVPAESKSHTIGPEGGTFQFADGVTVTVPKGAVTRKTTLSVTSPVLMNDKDRAPFMGLRSAAVKFDVSLRQGLKGNIQPLKPLNLTVKLAGVWTPGGAKPRDAKVYTEIGDRYILAGSRVNGTVLTASLGHLSPKYVAYVSDADLVKSFDADKVERDRAACAQQIGVTGGKVLFGPNSRGWSTRNDSPLFACLSKGSDGYVRVGLANRIEYILSVAATSDVRLTASSGDAETEIVKSITRHLFPNKKTKVLVGGGDTAVGSVRVGNLPATIEAVADPGTFFADGTYRVLGLAVSLVTGVIGKDALKDVERLLKMESVTSCLRAAANDMGKNPTMSDVVSGGFKCAGPIISAMAELFGLGKVWARAQWIMDALIGIRDTAVGAWNGISLTLGGTIRVQVVTDVPSVPACPSDAEIVRTWERDMPSATRESLSRLNYDRSEVLARPNNRCVSPWVLTTLLELNTDGQPIISVPALFHLEGGNWRLVEFGEQLGAPDTVMCTSRIPRALRPEAWVLQDGSTC